MKSSAYVEHDNDEWSKSAGWGVEQTPNKAAQDVYNCIPGQKNLEGDLSKRYASNANFIQVVNSFALPNAAKGVEQYIGADGVTIHVQFSTTRLLITAKKDGAAATEQEILKASPSPMGPDASPPQLLLSRPGNSNFLTAKTLDLLASRGTMIPGLQALASDLANDFRGHMGCTPKKR